jgi:hypothetical protein
VNLQCFRLAEPRSPREPRARAEEKQIRTEEVDGKKVRREAALGEERLNPLDACFPFVEGFGDQKSPKVNGKSVYVGRARDCFSNVLLRVRQIV